MDRRNPRGLLGGDAVEPSSKGRKSQHSFQQQEAEHEVLPGNNNTTEGEEHEEEEEGPDWSKVLQDILELVTGHLHIGDRIQSSRVCKRWRSVVMKASPKSRPASYGRPCLLRLLHGQRRRCILTDHIRNEHYVIETPSIPQGAMIAHSNNGWLLLAKYKRPVVGVFFFNPLTQATIELPELETNQSHSFSFSSEPTSSECRVVTNPISSEINSISFCYWVPGAKEWKIFTVNHQESIFSATFNKPFVAGDRIYHLGNNGRTLGMYNLSDQKLTVIGESPTKIGFLYFDRYFFVEMDDKLIFVSKEGTTGCRRIHLYEYDESKKQMIKMESTRGRSLFLCYGNCIFTEATTSGVEGERVYAWEFMDNEITMSHACVTNEAQTVRKFGDDSKDNLDSHWFTVCWIDLKS